MSRTRPRTLPLFIGRDSPFNAGMRCSLPARLRIRGLVLTLVLALGWEPRSPGQTASLSADTPGSGRWQGVADTEFLQETGRQIPFDQPLTAVAAEADAVWVGTAQGLYRVQGETLAPVAGWSGPVRRLVRAGGVVWALTGGGAFRHEANAWRRVTEEPVTDLTDHRGTVVLGAGRRLWTWSKEASALKPYAEAAAPFSLERVVSHQESLWVLGEGRLTTLRAGVFGGRDAYGFPADQVWDWGALPSPRVRDVVGLGNRLVLATDRGLGELRGMSLTTVQGAQGLPYEDTTCVAAGFTNDLWIGTSRGVIRQIGGDFHYFAGRRWLPAEHVQALAVEGRTVYVATEGGLGILEYRPFTLAKKAAYYDRYLDAWGQRRLGFVHKLEWDAALKEYVREISDNDGGYTGNYLAAQCYRWAVTRDPAARREATNTFHALRWLEGMTGLPGFPARSVWVKGERGHQAGHGSGGYAAEWHDTADGRFEWKGDTSSDELCSHFYAITLFLELVANAEEAALAKRHLARVAGHLVDHGWQLIDVDGKPTRWGRWDPDYFLSDEGRHDRGLQTVELLSFIRTAATQTGEARFADAYRRLLDLGYPAHTLRPGNVFPPESTLHFLDELAFWSFWTLLRYEPDADLRALYRRGYERSYENVRGEQNPWFNFLYGALTGTACEVPEAVAHLREWPLDLRIWSYQNSHRADLRTPARYVAPKGGTKAFSPREREPCRWDAWTMKADGGTGGNDVVEPGPWLLAYWMGRYYGFVGAPAEGALVELRESEVPAGGARAYEGPGRPVGY